MINTIQYCKSMKPLQRGEQSKIFPTGRHTYGIQNISVRSWGEGAHLFIGGFCSIASNQTIFLGGNHRIDWTTTFPFGHIFNEKFPAGQINGNGHPATKGHVTIENDVWIGSQSVILPGSYIKKGCIISSGSIVSGEFPEYSVIMGNPARVIKSRN